MYDFAHTLSDAFEGITHSLCTLEFEDHRPLYEWFSSIWDLPSRPRQIEFSRLNLAYTVTSKRRLAELIEAGDVSGWDDPRLPTIAGMQRRGYPAAALRDFVARAGVTKKNKLIELGLLENSARERLGRTADRRMAVLNPLKIVLTNVAEGSVEYLPAQNHPQEPQRGTRELPFGRELWIERDDFMEDAPRKFFRLKPGAEVRLRFAYIIRCDEVLKNDAGEVTALHCSIDPDTRSGQWLERPKGEGHDSLGVCGTRGGGRGSLVRSTIQDGQPGAVRGSDRGAESGLVAGQGRLSGTLFGALRWQGRGAVRAARLFLPGQRRRQRRTSGVQSNRDAAR